MHGSLQGSLLDVADEISIGRLGASVRRVELGAGAWLDLRPQWVTGADELFARLLEGVPWRAERRRMYDRVVDVPRLLCSYREEDELPEPALGQARATLSEHYRGELGESFSSVGLCLYRDGRDSVAWHGDTFGRGRTQDTMVAILSLGAPRTLALRPRGGGREPGRERGEAQGQEAGERADRQGVGVHRYELGHGDLLVMGGSCQRTWEHAVPKTSRPVGPRISAQFRARGVW